MADDAQRGVTFTLKANVDPSAKQIMESWFNGINSSIENLGNATSAAAASTTQSVAAATSAAQQSVAGSTATQTSQIEQFFDQTNQAAQAYLDSQAQRAAQQAQREQQLRDVSQMSLQELLAEQTANTSSAFDREKQIMANALREEEAAMKRYFEAIDALRKKALQDADSITDQEVEDVQELERAAVSAAERRSDAETRFSNAQLIERRREVQERIRGIREAEAQAERAAERTQRANEQISTSTGRIISAFSEGSEALMRFVNGIQHLGLVGEKDLQKVQDAILRIQGTTQVFTGLIRLIRQVTEGIDAYRRVVEIASAAQAVSAAATAVDTAATNANTAAHAANTATRNVPLMARGVMAAAGAGESLIGAASGYAIAAGGSSLAVFGAAVAAATGGLFALGSAIATAREAFQHGVGGGATKGGVVESIGTASWNPFVMMLRNLRTADIERDTGLTSGGLLRDERGDAREAYIEAEAAQKRLNEALKLREFNLAKQAQDEKELNRLQTERASSMSRQSALAREMTDASIRSLEPEQRKSELIKVIANTEANASLSVEDRARRVIQLSRERLQAEQEIHRTQLQAAKDAEREDERKLNDINKRIESERASMLSAQERFGLLGEAEQENIVDMSRRLQQGGAGQLEVQELQRLRGFSGAIDEQISAEARRRAQAAGFGAVQAGDIQRIQGLEQQKVQIEASIKAQAQVIAKLEIDAKAVADQINQQIDAQLRIIMAKMVDDISKNTVGIKKLEDAMLQRFAR